MKKKGLTVTVELRQVEVFQDLLTLIQDFLNHPELTPEARELYFKEIQALMERYHEEVGIEC